MSRRVPETTDNRRVGLRNALMKPVRWIWSVRGATLLCGALLVLAFPAVNFEYLAWFGLVIFAGLTMFDFQRLRRSTDLDSAPLIAASIFLDALNVFLFFLRIFSRGQN